MGFIKTFIGGAKDNQRIANGVSYVINILHDYELSKDSDYLITAAYVTRLSILDTIEKSGFHATYYLYAMVNGTRVKMTWAQAYAITCGKIRELIENIDIDSKECIESILDKGEGFYEMDKRMPFEKKKLFLK